MSEIPLADIVRFQYAVGAEDLYDWLGAREDAPRPEILKALQARRAWAQAQQSNPKFREAAVWLIRNYEAVLVLLVDEPERYRIMRQRYDRHRRLNLLREVVHVMAKDAINPADVSFFHRFGDKLNLERWDVEQVLREARGALEAVERRLSLPEVLRKVREKGIPESQIEATLRLGRANGLSTQEVAMVLLDELKRWSRASA